MQQDKLKAWLKRFKANETQLSVLSGFLFVVITASVLVGLNFYYKRQGQTSSTSSNQEIVVSPPMINRLPEATERPELPVMYKVQPGDSSWRIATAFYGDGNQYAVIERENKLTSDQGLEIGQELIIPKLDQPEVAIPAEQPDSDIHVIQSGESLWIIAGAALGDSYRWPEIYELNREAIGANPDLIYPNTTLRLPTE